MRTLWFVLLLFSSFLLAQESNPSNPGQQNSKTSKGQITVRGCVGCRAAHLKRRKLLKCGSSNGRFFVGVAELGDLYVAGERQS